MAFIRFNGFAQMFQAALSGGNPQAANVVDVDYNGFNFQLDDPSNDDFLHYMALPNSQESQAWSYDSQNTAYEFEDNNLLISAPAPAVGHLHTPTQVNLAQGAVPTLDNEHVIAYNPPKSHPFPAGAHGEPTVHTHLPALVTTSHRSPLPHDTEQTAGHGYPAARDVSFQVPTEPGSTARDPSPSRAESPEIVELARAVFNATSNKPARIKREREEEDLHELPPATRQRVDKGTSRPRQEPDGPRSRSFGKTSETVADTTEQRWEGPPNEGREWGSADTLQMIPPMGAIRTSGPPTDFPTWEEAMARAERSGDQDRMALVWRNRPFNDEWNAELQRRMVLRGFPKGTLGSKYCRASCEEEQQLRLEREEQERDEQLHRIRLTMTPGVLGLDLGGAQNPVPSMESEMLEESSSRASSEESVDPRLPILQDHLAAVGAVPPPPPAPPLPSPPGTPTSELSDLPPLPDMGDLPPLVASTQPPSTQPRVPRSHGESASGGLSHENSIGGPSSSAFVHPIAAERNFASLPKRAGKGKGVPQTTLTTFDGRGALDMVDPVRCKVEPDEDAIVQPLRVDKGKKRAVEKRSVEDDAASLPDASRKRPKLSIQSHSSERRATTPRRGRNIPTHAETGSWISVETSAPSLEQSRSNTAGLAAGTSGSSHNNTATVQQWLASTADLPPHVNAQGDAHGMGSLTTRAVHREGRRHRRVDANFMVESRLVYGLEDHNIAEADRPVVVIPDGRTSATNATALPWPEDSVQPVPEQPQPVTQQFQSIPTPTPLPVPEQPQYMPLPEDESEARQNPKPEPFDIVAWYAAGNFDYWTLPPYIRKAIAPHLPLKPPPCRERLLFSKGSSSRRRNVPNRERGGIPHVFGGSTSTAASSNLPHQFHGSTSTAASNDVPDLFRASTSTAASGNIPHLSRGSTSTAASSSVPYPFHGSTSTAASSKVVEDPYSELFAYRPRY